MGRWVDISRVRVPRDWMLPNPEEFSLDSDRVTQYEQEPVQTAERPRRARWSRGRRGPLRRNEGVPDPLETPGFLLRADIPREPESRFRIPLPLAVFLASALVTAVLTRMIGG